MTNCCDKHTITKQECFKTERGCGGIGKVKILADIYVDKKTPILRYCNLSSKRINAFIKEINVACMSGERITMDGAVEPYCLNFNSECIGYVTSTMEENCLLPEKIKDFFIFCKPDAVVTKEGIALFYNDMNIAATITGKDWCFLSLDIEWAENYAQKEIRHIKEIVSDCEKTIIIFEMDDKTLERFELRFELNLLEEGDIIDSCLAKERM